MKSTGIVRKVDELGRISVPIELRRTLNIAEKDSVEIYVDGDKIILKKFEPSINREEKVSVLAGLQTLIEQEKNPNKKDILVRTVAMISERG